MSWTWSDVPDQGGRRAVVTGANCGIGYEAARTLAERGAEVVLACRDLDRAQQAADRIRAGTPGARVTTLHLDLASLASVRRAAEQLSGAHHRLDLPSCSGGWPPRRRRRSPSPLTPASRGRSCSGT